MPKIFVVEPFSALCQKFSGSEKVYVNEGGVVSRFLSKIFCLTQPKIFVGEPFSVSLVSANEKF